ncbi:hypothetical protein GTA08_BOTSDO02284 [Botryosphaeria dothidea]|uniref:Rhodopsin domain-containing protein n=1 Tax=Botryosphaeria dothidea TaxID=55169 RepID=A0A8H4J0U9_9PEZI|nr:hypothetical protein GTA08_BOTSDO02284 [Botryosphaeria dothidea]
MARTSFEYGFTPEAFILLSLGVLIICLRVTLNATSRGIRGLEWDDYCMLLVMVIVYTLETVTAYAQGAFWAGLANNGMTDEQRRQLDLRSYEYYLRVNGSKTQLVGWALYILMLWLCKLSVCFFYSRLTSGLQQYDTRLKICYGIILATFIATEATALLGCQPFHHNWQVHPDPGNHCQPAISKPNLYVTVVLNTSTDALLTSIPLRMLWTAKTLPLRTKLSLTVIFCGAIFVMAAGILRCALILSDPSNAAPARATSWACRETFVAVVISNAPMLYQHAGRGVRYVRAHEGFVRRWSGGASAVQEIGCRMRTFGTGRQQQQQQRPRMAGASRLASTGGDEEEEEGGSIAVVERGGSWFVD